MKNFQVKDLPALIGTLPPEDPDQDSDNLRTMVFQPNAGYFDIIDQARQVQKAYYPDEIRGEKDNDKEPSKKKKFYEVTFDNFEDICEDKSGFCMIGMLPGITEIDYEKEAHE